MYRARDQDLSRLTKVGSEQDPVGMLAAALLAQTGEVGGIGGTGFTRRGTQAPGCGLTQVFGGVFANGREYAWTGILLCVWRASSSSRLAI